MVNWNDNDDDDDGNCFIYNYNLGQIFGDTIYPFGSDQSIIIASYDSRTHLSLYLSRNSENCRYFIE